MRCNVGIWAADGDVRGSASLVSVPNMKLQNIPPMSKKTFVVADMKMIYSISLCKKKDTTLSLDLFSLETLPGMKVCLITLSKNTIISQYFCIKKHHMNKIIFNKIVSIIL